MSHKVKPDHRVKVSVIQPRSVLNRSGMGGYTLNPYAGCPVGCAYCYVPLMAHKQSEPRKWGTYVDVKEGVAQLLEKRLANMRKPANVFMSTATDPYQPIEERYRITREILKVFERHPRHGLFILTKQPLVERDTDILTRLPRVAVGMSISVMRDDLAEVIEPWAPVTSERLACINRLSALGIDTYVLWAPVIIPVPLTEEFINDSVRTIARTNTKALSLDAMNYLSRQPVGLARRLEREGHAPASKAQAEQIRLAANRLGLGGRLDIIEAATAEELTPMLPFDKPGAEC